MSKLCNIKYNIVSAELDMDYKYFDENVIYRYIKFKVKRLSYTKIEVIKKLKETLGIDIFEALNIFNNDDWYGVENLGYVVKLYNVFGSKNISFKAISVEDFNEVERLKIERYKELNGIKEANEWYNKLSDKERFYVDTLIRDNQPIC
tara:strand:+ start:4178 stop:4621 length:444 start_codon:yes stop_codon:yes gene_type:complete